MPDGAAKRLSPEARAAEILKAAKRLLDREGVRGFSLEAVAREAGVAASLPRHYFGGTVELLSTSTIDVLKEVEQALRARNTGVSLEERFTTYLDLIERHPWGHSVWMRSSEIHPTIETLVRKARNRMGEAIYHKPWNSLTRKEQIHARGCVGFVEAVVSDWVERDFADRKLVLEALMYGVQSFQAENQPAKQRVSPKGPRQSAPKGAGVKKVTRRS